MAKRNREALEAAFPVAYIENGLNATRAYKSLKVNAKDTTARVEGSSLLAKPDIRARIMSLLPSEEVEAGVIRDALTRKPRKEITYAEKHKYLETSLKLKGLLNHDEGTSNVQVGIIIER